MIRDSSKTLVNLRDRGQKKLYFGELKDTLGTIIKSKFTKLVPKLQGPLSKNLV